jgi:hypothetical protein
MPSPVGPRLPGRGRTAHICALLSECAILQHSGWCAAAVGVMRRRGGVADRRCGMPHGTGDTLFGRRRRASVMPD